MPRIPLGPIPLRIVQLLTFAVGGLIPACQTEQQSLVLDDYRLRLTAESGDLEPTALADNDEGQTIDCLVGHVAGRPMYAHDILDPMQDELSAVEEVSHPSREGGDGEGKEAPKKFRGSAVTL